MPSWVRPPGWTRDDPGQRLAPAPVVATPRTAAPARGDGGPPIAAGPGPVYNFNSPGSSASARGDGGPPLAPGPGPLFSSTRRAPTVAADDSGPPIAAGPGPVYNWTTTRER